MKNRRVPSSPPTFNLIVICIAHGLENITKPGSHIRPEKVRTFQLHKALLNIFDAHYTPQIPTYTPHRMAYWKSCARTG